MKKLICLAALVYGCGGGGGGSETTGNWRAVNPQHVFSGGCGWPDEPIFGFDSGNCTLDVATSKVALDCGREIIDANRDGASLHATGSDAGNQPTIVNDNSRGSTYGVHWNNILDVNDNTCTVEIRYERAATGAYECHSLWRFDLIRR